MALTLPDDVVFEKLDVKPGDTLVIKSANIDVDDVRAVRERFGGRVQVLGIGPEDSVLLLTIKPEDALVIRTPDMPDEITRGEVESTLKARTGCKAVFFLGPEVELSVRSNTVVQDLVDRLSGKKTGWHCDNCHVPTPPDQSTNGAYHTVDGIGCICGKIVRD